MSDNGNGGLAAAWQEAGVLFRLAQQTGDFDTIRADIRPSADSDAAMTRYRNLVLSFFNHFARVGGVPKRPPFRLTLPKPRKPYRFRSRVSPEKERAIAKAIQEGRTTTEIRLALRCGCPLIQRVRLQLERELVDA